MTPAFPKPKPRPKRSPSTLTRRSPMRRGRMKAGKRGTRHSRRPRELGFMAFCHGRGCELCLDVDTQKLFGICCPCSGPLEFAHLSDRKRYDVGDIGACLHQWIHRGIDGKEGGKHPWYVALERSGQHLIRMRLANRARAAWEGLTTKERQEWECRAKVPR